MSDIEKKEFIDTINSAGEPTHPTSDEFDQQNEELFRFVNNHSNERKVKEDV